MKEKKNTFITGWRGEEGDARLTLTHTCGGETIIIRNMQKRWGSPVNSHRATYLFGSFRSGGVSVSTSVESVKIKPNCGGKRRAGQGEEEEEGRRRKGRGVGQSVKSSTRSTKAFFFLFHHHPHTVAFATSTLANKGNLAFDDDGDDGDGTWWRQAGDLI